MPRTSARPSSTTPAPGSASSRNISSTRTAVRSASRQRLSGAAGPVLHRRRLQERRRCRPQDRGRASQPLPRRRHQPRRHQRRSGQGPVGIPDFRQGLQDRRRPDVDGPLPDAAPDRELRHRHRIPLQAARRYRLERLRHARQLLDHLYARSRRQGILREADGSLQDQPRRPHRGLWSGQPHASDRQARDGVDRYLQLRRGRPRRLDPRSALASSTTATRAIWKTAVRTRKATPTRSLRRS